MFMELIWEALNSFKIIFQTVSRKWNLILLSFSSWLVILLGVLQETIMVPAWFNIFLNDSIMV